MGFVRGLTGARQAKEAANVQVQSGNRAIDLLREELGIARERSAPFEELGLEAIGDIRAFDPAAQQEFAAGRTERLRDIGERENPLFDDLVTAGTAEGQSIQDIEALRNFRNADVLDDPLFQGLADDVQQRLFASQAAGGKFGSGETGVRLGERLVPLGLDFADRRFNQLKDVADLQSGAERDAFDKIVRAAGTTEDITNSEFRRELQSIATESGIATDRFNQLLELIGVGQEAVTSTSRLGADATTSIADTILGQGNVTAAGIIGAGNANRDILTSIIGAVGPSIFDSVFGRNPNASSVPVEESIGTPTPPIGTSGGTATTTGGTGDVAAPTPAIGAGNQPIDITDILSSTLPDVVGQDVSGSPVGGGSPDLSTAGLPSFPRIPPVTLPDIFELIFSGGGAGGAIDINQPDFNAIRTPDFNANANILSRPLPDFDFDTIGIDELFRDVESSDFGQAVGGINDQVAQLIEAEGGIGAYIERVYGMSVNEYMKFVEENGEPPPEVEDAA